MVGLVRHPIAERPGQRIGFDLNTPRHPSTLPRHRTWGRSESVGPAAPTVPAGCGISLGPLQSKPAADGSRKGSGETNPEISARSGRRQP